MKLKSEKTGFSSLCFHKFNLCRYIQEVQSRRAFALEHQQELARQTKGGADWFKWGVIDDGLVKPANKEA